LQENPERPLWGRKTNFLPLGASVLLDAAYRAVPTSEAHIEGVWKALDFVARERRFLAFVEAPPLARSRDFIPGNITKGNPQYVALAGNGGIGLGMGERQHSS
jgi:hypothetical protein